MSIVYYRPGAGECAAAIALKAGVHEAYMLGYSQPFPNWTSLDEDIYLLGLIPRAYELQDLVKNGNVTFIDHRNDNIATMEKLCNQYNLKIQMVVSDTVPMTVLTWQYFFPNIPIPACVELFGRYKIWDIDDRVLEFNAGCRIQQTNKISTWLQFLDNTDNIFENTMQLGKTIREYYDTIDAYAANHMVFETEMEGVRIYAANTRTASSQIFKYVKTEGPDRPQHGVLYQWDRRRKAYSLTIYDLVDKPSISSTELAKKHGGGGGSSAVANFHAMFDKLPFEQRAGAVALNGAPDMLDIKDIEDRILEQDSVMERAIDHEHTMAAYKQQLIALDDGDKAIVANLMHLEWATDYRIVNTAKWKIAWCWIAQDDDVHKGCYRIMKKSLMPGAPSDCMVEYVDKLPFNPMMD